MTSGARREPARERLDAPDCCIRRALIWPKSGFLGLLAAFAGAGFTKNYALAWFDPAGNPLPNRNDPAAPMTLSVAHASEDASPMRGLLPLWVGVGIYALFLLAGNRLLIDPDTMWQITVGQWILDHRAVPETDVFSFTMRGQPWISTQWLAQVLFAKSLCAVRLERAGGDGGIRDRGNLRAVHEIPEPAFERKHDAGVRRRGAGADGAASVGAAACAGDAGDGGVGRRTDRGRRSARRRRRSGCCR